MKTEGRIIDKGGKRENPWLDEKTRLGIPTLVLIITRVYYSAGKNTIPKHHVLVNHQSIKMSHSPSCPKGKIFWSM